MFPGLLFSLSFVSFCVATFSSFLSFFPKATFILILSCLLKLFVEIFLATCDEYIDYFCVDALSSNAIQRTKRRESMPIKLEKNGKVEEQVIDKLSISELLLQEKKVRSQIHHLHIVCTL